MPPDVTDMQLDQRVIENQRARRIMQHRDGRDDKGHQHEDERDAECTPLGTREHTGAIALHVLRASLSTSRQPVGDSERTTSEPQTPSARNRLPSLAGRK